MEIVRSDTPEVTRCIASAGVRASRHLPALGYGCFPNVLILVIAFTVTLTISMRAATCLSCMERICALVYKILPPQLGHSGLC
jgi:hypothetical protein